MHLFLLIICWITLFHDFHPTNAITDRDVGSSPRCPKFKAKMFNDCTDILYSNRQYRKTVSGKAYRWNMCYHELCKHEYFKERLTGRFGNQPTCTTDMQRVIEKYCENYSTFERPQLVGECYARECIAVKESRTLDKNRGHNATAEMVHAMSWCEMKNTQNAENYCYRIKRAVMSAANYFGCVTDQCKNYPEIIEKENFACPELMIEVIKDFCIYFHKGEIAKVKTCFTDECTKIKDARDRENYYYVDMAINKFQNDCTDKNLIRRAKDVCYRAGREYNIYTLNIGNFYMCLAKKCKGNSLLFYSAYFDTTPDLLLGQTSN